MGTILSACVVEGYQIRNASLLLPTFYAYDLIRPGYLFVNYSTNTGISTIVLNNFKLTQHLIKELYNLEKVYFTSSIINKLSAW